MRPHRGLLSAAALAFLACTGSNNNEHATMRGAGSLSRQERVAVFEDVWKTIADQYYDSTFHHVDWRAVGETYRPLAEATNSDPELYRMFEVMLAELKDAHTGFTHPTEAGDSTFQPTGDTGLRLGMAEEKTVVTVVDSGSDPALAGVKPGMILHRVNGRLVPELYKEITWKIAGSSTERAMSQVMNGALLFGGFLGPSREFEVEAFDGRRFKVPIKHFRPFAPGVGVVSRRLRSGNAYIKFDGWKAPADTQFKSALMGVMDARGLIIDLRGNGGGESEVVLEIASLFFRDPTSFGGFKKRGGVLETIVTHPEPRPYRGAIAILMDEASASASEVFAISMQEHGRARIVGRASCGCVLNQWTKGEKGGGVLRWSARIYTSPKGRVIEGSGVLPDAVVPLRIIDLRDRIDAALSAADTLLASPWRANSNRQH